MGALIQSALSSLLGPLMQNVGGRIAAEIVTAAGQDLITLAKSANLPAALQPFADDIVAVEPKLEAIVLAELAKLFTAASGK